jgi:hypothetical protein
MTVSSATSNSGSIDNEETATLASKMSQFGSATLSSSFDNIIDVATVRKTFTSGTTDTMSWSVANPTTTDWLNLATINSNYTSAGSAAGAKTITSDLASGAWALNGASVVIPYIPYNDNASQIVYLTNKGTQTGDITITAFESNGTKYDLGVVAPSVGG